MIDKAILKRNFSKKANLYDSYANVQREMARTLISSVDFNRLASRSKVLEIGSGTGYMTKLIDSSLKGDCSIDAVDIAEGMVRKAKSVMGERVNFLCDDIESMEFLDTYDLIISNATFQWLNDLEATSSKLLSAIRAGGSLVFSTFGERTFEELHSSYERSKKSLGIADASSLGQSFYPASHIRDIISQNMMELGIPVDIRIREQLICEKFNSSREFLHSVKSIGASNTKSISSVKALREAMRIYDREYRYGDGVQASYHCIYVEIRRA